MNDYADIEKNYLNGFAIGDELKQLCAKRDRLREVNGELLAALKRCLHTINHAYGGADNFAVLDKAAAIAAIARAEGK